MCRAWSRATFSDTSSWVRWSRWGPGIAPERLQVGDRVVVPFTIACGNCFFCRQDLWSCCDNTNPNAWMAEAMFGSSPSGCFGYSHLTGGYAGGQAQFVRVPFADVGPLKVPAEMSEEDALFLSDILPTGYMAAENCNIEPGDTVAVWGCGPVGQFAIRSALLLGAERVIAIDRVVERLELARRGGALTLNYEQVESIPEVLKDWTGWLGPDSCIDAVGMEADGHGLLWLRDRLAQALRLEDRAVVLRECIRACRKGGTVSMPGVYGGFTSMIPMGAFMNKGLTLNTGQTHVMRYLQPLLERIERGEFKPSEIVSHRLPLEQAPAAYRMFREKKDHCTKVVLDPWAEAA